MSLNINGRENCLKRDMAASAAIADAQHDGKALRLRFYQSNVTLRSTKPEHLILARRPFDLPPLTALLAFEAAARNGSVKDAAAELNVTPGAVSRQIRTVEDELATPLFTRVHRGIELTPEGADLSASISRGLADMSVVCQRIRQRPGSPHLTIAATTAFAGMWLIPRMGTFWRLHPTITVNHLISDELPSPYRSDIDLAIVYGNGAFSGFSCMKLYNDRLYPVCSPEFAQKHPARTGRELLNCPLLRMKSGVVSWIDWESFFEWTGLEDPGYSGLSMNNYTVAIQAARDGQGVALGWDRFVRDLIDTGDLVRLTDLEMPAPGAQYIVWPEGRSTDHAAEIFRDWLIQQAHD